MLREGKITDAYRSPASQTSPLKEQNRVVMLREGRRGAGGAASRWALFLEWRSVNQNWRYHV
jgi:hypothetical protein